MIEVTDIQQKYVSIAEARRLSGLRIVLGAYAIPGPWREACKGVFHVKRLPYVPVVTASAGRSDLEFGKDGADQELREWSGQSSAPVVIWNDEPPRSTWIAQLQLAERLQPEPPLIPEAIADRVTMFGLANELCGENGLAWWKRIAILHANLEAAPADDPNRGFWLHVGGKYGYSPAAGAAAPARIVTILRALDEQLRGQRARGKRYLVGDRLSALDVYWAAFAGLMRPLAPELCRMATSFRALYDEKHPTVLEALTPALIEHRDFVYREHLELPVVF